MSLSPSQLHRFACHTFYKGPSTESGLLIFIVNELSISHENYDISNEDALLCNQSKMMKYDLNASYVTNPHHYMIHTSNSNMNGQEQNGGERWIIPESASQYILQKMRQVMSDTFLVSMPIYVIEVELGISNKVDVEEVICRDHELVHSLSQSYSQTSRLARLDASGYLLRRQLNQFFIRENLPSRLRTIVGGDRLGALFLSHHLCKNNHFLFPNRRIILDHVGYTRAAPEWISWRKTIQKLENVREDRLNDAQLRKASLVMAPSCTFSNVIDENSQVSSIFGPPFDEVVLVKNADSEIAPQLSQFQWCDAFMSPLIRLLSF